MKGNIVRKTSRQRHALLAGLAAVLLAGEALAQAYPAKPIRVIDAYPPGGGTDIVARTVSPKFQESLGQPWIIDNRAGAQGIIGAEIAAKSAPDGYTLLMFTTNFTIHPSIYKNLPYDFNKAFTPVTQTSSVALAMIVHPSVPTRTVKELIALAKSKPGSLNFASTGTGGNTHLATELFNIMAGTQMTHVPYKGTGPALNDLLGGQVQLIMGTLGVMLPHVKTGRLHGLAVTTAKRNSALPEIPTIAETLPGYEATLWYGILGPKGLPKNVVALWNTEVRKAAQSADVKQRFAAEGIEASDGPPELFRDIVQRDVAKWITVVKTANIKPIQ